MSDVCDRTDKHIFAEGEARIQAHLNRPREIPDEEIGPDGLLHRYCLDCASELAEDRLEAEPTAVRCVPCQTRKEPRR